MDVNRKFENCIKEHLPTLIQVMTNADNILDYLWQHGFIGREEYLHIAKKFQDGQEVRNNREVIQLILMKNIQAMQGFMSSLEATGQDYLLSFFQHIWLEPSRGQIQVDPGPQEENNNNNNSSVQGQAGSDEAQGICPLSPEPGSLLELNDDNEYDVTSLSDLM